MTVSGWKRTAREAAQLVGVDNVKDKVFLITGGYAGLGAETASALLSVGGKVIIGGRNPKILEEFLTKLKEEFPDKVNNINGHVLDLANLQSVKDFCTDFILVHHPPPKKKYYSTTDNNDDDGVVLICNAGIMNTPPSVTQDGLEVQFGVNCVGHFLLCLLLADITKRQVWLTSCAHKTKGAPRIDLEYLRNFNMENDTTAATYDGWKAYQQSKLGNILLPKEFHKRYKHIEVCSVHPGIIPLTGLLTHTAFWNVIKFTLVDIPCIMYNGDHPFPKTIPMGAATTVTCATMPSEELVNGAYYSDCAVGTEAESAKNEEDAKALFDYCDEITKKFQ